MLLPVLCRIAQVPLTMSVRDPESRESRLGGQSMGLHEGVSVDQDRSIQLQPVRLGPASRVRHPRHGPKHLQMPWTPYVYMLASKPWQNTLTPLETVRPSSQSPKGSFQ